MATELTAPLMRETGLKKGEREVFVVLSPSDTGGTISFREKGKGGKGAEIELSKVMDAAYGGEAVPSGEPTAPALKSCHPDDPDLVDLAILEARLMIQADEIIPLDVRAKVWEIIREIREERREDMGEPTIGQGSKRNKAKRDRESVRE
jgi:hypothetical protein